jgi:tetratricopeptide (TPR) repeat protein
VSARGEVAPGLAAGRRTCASEGYGGPQRAGRRVVALWLVALAGAGAAPAWAQDPAGPSVGEPPEAELPLLDEGDEPAEPGEAAEALRQAIEAARGARPTSKDGMPVMDTTCPGADEFGGTPEERAGYCQLGDGSIPEQERYVAVRTWADKALRADATSYRAHFLMGAAQHLGEGNLPKSLFHLERADTLLTEQEGRFPAPNSQGWSVLRRVLLELVYVHGEMDHHEDKVRFVDQVQERLGLDYSALKAWPLMKLKRWEEARVIARQSIEGSEDHSYWRSVGLTALCAIESELRNRQAAYDACLAAAQPVMRDPHDGGVALSNAASASVEMFKFDEAERLWLESAKRDIEGTINPWGRLTHLYLREGRMAEALSALREMRTYRMARPAYFDQQDQADAELTGAALLLIAGRTEDAHRITSRVAERPDRQGTSSAAFEQNQGGNFIFDRVTKLDVARRLEERAGSAPWREALALRAKAAKLRLDAWALGRRAATILADPERLVTTLRPECPGSLEMPAWLDADVIEIVGPGVALAAIAEARKEETLPEHLAEPVFAALEAEAYLQQGDDARALARAEIAIKGLLPAEALLRARAPVRWAPRPRGAWGATPRPWPCWVRSSPSIPASSGASVTCCQWSSWRSRTRPRCARPRPRLRARRCSRWARRAIGSSCPRPRWRSCCPTAARSPAWR